MIRLRNAPLSYNMATSPNLEIGEKYKRLTQDYAKVMNDVAFIDKEVGPAYY